MMPWVDNFGKQENGPSRYKVPRIEAAASWNKEDCDFIKSQRKKLSQQREEIIILQKECEKSKNYIEAKWYSETSSDLLKQQRGYDAVWKYLEGADGYNNWRMVKINKEIAPFVDAAFSSMLYRERSMTT